MPLLKLIRFLPVNPFRRLRNGKNLFEEYGKQILHEQGPEVDTERKVNSKDVMSLLSTCMPPGFKSACVLMQLRHSQG